MKRFKLYSRQNIKRHITQWRLLSYSSNEIVLFVEKSRWIEKSNEKEKHVAENNNSSSNCSKYWTLSILLTIQLSSKGKIVYWRDFTIKFNLLRCAPSSCSVYDWNGTHNHNMLTSDAAVVAVAATDRTHSILTSGLLLRCTIISWGLCSCLTIYTFHDVLAILCEKIFFAIDISHQVLDLRWLSDFVQVLGTINNNVFFTAY